MLGYRGLAVTVKGLGLGKGPMWQTALDCMGSEKNLQQCRIKLIFQPCSRFRPAAVTCSNIASDVDAALSSLLPQECGQTEDASTHFLTMLTKVRGGLTPTRFSTPWLVNLRFNNARRDISCGGNIISEDLVLTAAHCLGFGTSSLVVRVGDHNRGYYEDTEQEFTLENVFIHEDYYASSPVNNDIALLKLNRKGGRGIRFGPKVRPICLPKTTDSYHTLRSCTVVGWGPMYFGGKLAQVPQEASINVLPDVLCESDPSYGTSDRFTSSMVCIGVTGRPVNTCKGDSGGPLSCSRKEDGRRTVYGLSSFGSGCRVSETNDVFTRVSKFLPWILKTIRISMSS
ncbi:hypothetical protein Pmani_004318 [Petrolisthes manimaculis]|uniref:Uncharacterized protein n=1 Tax=Petrolisthes manimaculis TaxID=1843537 RepID=A0AAE1QFA6_9EUCA|nr:hypothetical protein Pmani_004318 [Petrolisthes manimaculis]